MTAKSPSEIRPFRYTADITLLNSLREPGIGKTEMFNNLARLLSAKVGAYKSVSRKDFCDRKMAYRYIDVPVQLHYEATDIWQWQKRCWGAGSVLNTSLTEAILDMKAKGITSFNAYCETLEEKK